MTNSVVTDQSSLIIAIASGKGGVGKTALAANLAFAFSEMADTLLIDLDLHNQGATSLLTGFSDPAGLDLASALMLPETATIPYGVVEGTSRIFFVRALPAKPLPFTEIRELSSSIYPGALSRFLGRLKLSGRFGCVILDCHGGIDELSYTAVKQADITLLVTEPD